MNTPHDESATPEASPSRDPSDLPPEMERAASELRALESAVASEVAGSSTVKPKRKKKGGGKKGKKKKEGGLGSSRGIETMFRTSYRTHIDLSHLADNKANIMISINGIIISILLASISPKIDANPWLLLPTSILLLGCLSSLVFAILAARPRVSSHTISLDDVYEDRANILFFGNFVTLDEDEFVDGMKSLMLRTDQLYVNMTRDIYSLGQVLSRKFRLLRHAYNIFMVGLVAGVITFIGVFVSVVVTQGSSGAILP